MSIEKTLQRSGFAKLFVSRPILGIVLNLLVVIAGVAALSAVDVREMPDVDQPVISIRTTYEGAVPETVDQDVTRVLEEALSAVDGLAFMESTSSSESSSITIELSASTNPIDAASEAREIVSEILSELPDSVETPVVTRTDSDSDPIIRLALSGDVGFAELTRIAEGQVSDRLSTIDGIAEITVRGDRVDEYRVTVNMPSLTGLGLTIDDVADALTALRDDTPLGELETQNQTLALRVGNAEISNEAIEQLPINSTAKIIDVAIVELLPEDASVYVRVNGQDAVGLDIARQSIGNTLDISEDVNLALQDLRSSLPSGVNIIVASDDGIFIKGSLKEVTSSILLATLIVISVIFLFLRSPRATLIPAITIPVALLGTISAIWITGFSINTISLLAMVLATGMVVDDAIVVVENIVRKRQQGMGAFAAACAGTNEVFFAVISTTATLAAVFIPISFLPGQAGGVFAEFGYVLAFAVGLSSFTALTLAPVLAALIDAGHSKKKIVKIQKPSIAMRGFNYFVDISTKNPVIVIALAGAFTIAAGGAALSLPSSITPNEDRGFFLIQARGPADTTPEYLDTQAVQIEELLQPYIDRGEISAVQSIIGVGGGSTALVIARLPEWTTRDRSQQEIIADINKQTGRIPGVQLSTRTSNSLNIRGSGQGLAFAVTGSSLEDITSASDTLVSAMRERDVFVNPQLSNTAVDAQMELTIDQTFANQLGLSENEISETVSTLVRGTVPVTVFNEGNELDVNVVPGGVPLDDPSDLENVSLRLDDGRFVPLSSVANLTSIVSPSQVERLSGSLSMSMQTNLASGVDLSTAITVLNEVAEEVLPDGSSIILTGEAATLTDGQSEILLVFAVAMLIVLLVLAAQFESFTSAIVILLTVPFGLAAALFAISLTGGSLNYYSQIGLVLLIGVMAKNGILIVEFANQLRERGQEIDEAIRNAMSLRIRPVMMTMVSTVLGGLPLVFSSGAGAEARAAVGWVIVGGLGFATLFTLVLTPVFYRLIAVHGSQPGSAAKRLKEEFQALSKMQ